MKGLFWTIFLICKIGFISQAQKNSVLISKKQIDYRNYPVQRFVDTVMDGKTCPKPSFAYIDSVVVYHIVYKSDDSLDICGYIVLPKKKGNYPCIIYNRGGNQDYGNLRVFDVVTTLGKLASNGYVVVASTYRGNSCSKGKDEFGGGDVRDVLNLMKVLPDFSAADTSRVGMMGFSRGGMMTYLCLTSHQINLKAAVVIGGPSDLADLGEKRPGMQKVYEELIPNYATNKEIELKKRSAVFWASDFPKATPMLLLHGALDEKVPLAQAQRLQKEFEKYQVPSELVIYEKDGHEFKVHQLESEALILSWFNKHLKR